MRAAWAVVRAESGKPLAPRQLRQRCHRQGRPVKPLPLNRPRRRLRLRRPRSRVRAAPQPPVALRARRRAPDSTSGCQSSAHRRGRAGCSRRCCAGRGSRGSPAGAADEAAGAELLPQLRFADGGPLCVWPDAPRLLRRAALSFSASPSLQSGALVEREGQVLLVRRAVRPQARLLVSAGRIRRIRRGAGGGGPSAKCAKKPGLVVQRARACWRRTTSAPIRAAWASLWFTVPPRSEASLAPGDDASEAKFFAPDEIPA